MKNLLMIWPGENKIFTGNGRFLMKKAIFYRIKNVSKFSEMYMKRLKIVLLEFFATDKINAVKNLKFCD